MTVSKAKGAGESKAKKVKASPAPNKKVAKKRPLTIKQKKLVKGIVAGKSQKDAAKDAGLNEQYASDILKKPEVKASLQELMEAAGLSDDVLLSKHKELLNAKREDVPDYQTQKSALEMAYKLKGAFVEKKEVTFPEGLTLEVVFGDE